MVIHLATRRRNVRKNWKTNFKVNSRRKKERKKKVHTGAGGKKSSGNFSAQNSDVAFRGSP